MDTLIQLPEPHSTKQSLIMNCARIPDLEEMWISSGSKFGKTLSGVGSYCALFPRLQTGVIRHIAPIYSQSIIGMEYAKKMLPSKDIFSRKSGKPIITWKDSRRDTVIEYWHGHDPEALEGEGTIFNLLDEASKMKRQVYDSVITTATRTNGLIVPMSTPRGKNWFYNGCMQAKEEMEWCLKKGKNPTKIFITAPTSANKFIDPKIIERNKRNLVDRLFRQYFLAEFIDDGEVFPFFKDAIYGHPLLFEFDSQVWFAPGAEDMDRIIIGADWGKTNDFSVFTAWSAQSKMMVGFMRFRGLDYISAIKNLVWFAGNYSDVMDVKHDKTGLGQVMDDHLAHTELRYEGVTFTNKSKSAMINSMMLAFQRHDIKIPNWPAMIDELDSFEVQTNEIGTMKYSAPSGMHDDIVCSMFLGWFGVEEYAPSHMEVITLDELSELELDREDFGPADTDFSKWESVN